MFTPTSRWTLELQILLQHKLKFILPEEISVSRQKCVCVCVCYQTCVVFAGCSHPAELVETNLDMLNKQTEAAAASLLAPPLPHSLW